MNAADLIQGKSYKIKHECSAYNGNTSTYYESKIQIIWIISKFVGMNKCWAEFEIEKDRIIRVDINNISTDVKEI